jgi:hydroxymethylglutaryl-CoA lyase
VISDTIGTGTPGSMARLLQLVTPHVSAEHLAVHCHDTYGQALANILVALQHGVSTVDSSVAGLGGCPFAGPGASGNVATEDVVYMLNGLGVETGVDFDRVVDTGEWIVRTLGRNNASKAGVASLRSRQAAAACSS